MRFLSRHDQANIKLIVHSYISDLLNNKALRSNKVVTCTVSEDIQQWRRPFLSVRWLETGRMKQSGQGIKSDVLITVRG